MYTSQAMDFGHDGRYVLYADADTIYLKDLYFGRPGTPLQIKSGAGQFGMQSTHQAVAVTKDGKSIAAPRSEQVALFDATLAANPNQQNFERSVRALIQAPCARHTIAKCIPCRVRRWL